MPQTTELLCYGLMLAVAAAASWTDLRRGLIPNRLVLVGLAAAVVLHGAAWVATSGLVAGPGPDPSAGARLAAVGLNGGVGLVAGLALYWVGLWSAGDAKLAAVLALAQPAWVELRGPVPWAPSLVLFGNALVVGLGYVVAELIFRGVPRLVVAVRRRARRGPEDEGEGDRTALWAVVARGGRIGLTMSAFATALGPIRSWAAEHLGARLPGGTFLAFLLLFALYRPLRRLALRPWGLPATLGLLLLSAIWSIWSRGEAGALAVGRSLLVAAAVMAARGALGLSSRTFDARRIAASELRPGMVLATGFIERMEADARWQEAFAPIVGDLRRVKLDQNLIDNVREWHAHNAPDEEVEVAAPLPFAPALAVAVVLTAAFGRIVIGTGP